MADEFKLGVVQSPVVHGSTPQPEGPKLGVVLPDAAQTVITPPGLGVVPRELITIDMSSGIPAPMACVAGDVDWSRVHEIKRTWIAQKGKPGSDQVLRSVANEIYGLLHLPPPAIYRFESPLAAMLSMRHLARIYGIEVDHTPTMLEQLRAPISAYLGPIDQAKKRSDEFCRELSFALGVPVPSQLNSKFLDRFTDQITSAIGSLDASTRIFDPIPQRVFSWWTAIADSRCWWWPYSRFLVVSDDPVVHYDEDGREHRTDGPAVEFADGYAVYFYEGHRVPEQVILRPQSLTIDEIDGEKNSEIRRIMIAQFG
jgi:hypothetical protein